MTDERPPRPDAGAPDVTVRRLAELEAFYHDSYRRLRAGLGVRAFGTQVVELEPNTQIYPEHDHAQDGQEELYVTLAGAGTLVVGEERYDLDPDVFVRVGPNERRKVVTGDAPIRLVIIGGVPDQAYVPPAYTELGGVAALAVASASPTSVRVGEDVVFDASTSTAGSATDELAFAWDFDGSGSFVETGPTATYAYGAPGAYTAVLRVRDTAGRSNDARVPITVRA